MFRFTLITFFVIHASLVSSQEIVKAKGNAEMRMEDHLSLDATKEEVKRLAMINAIEKEFGVYVEQDSDVDIENGKTDFKILGHTRVRGDWIRTTKIKFEEEKRRIRGSKKKDMEVWIYCSIEGWIREIKSPQTALDITPLNCPDQACRTYDFKEGEPMYLSFQTKNNGYLSVFAVQDDGMAYRILPYQSMPEIYNNAVPVHADRSYTFFSNEEEHDYFEGFPYLLTDELIMFASGPREYIKLYIVFSAHEYDGPFLKEVQNKEDYSMPVSLTEEGFNEWLTENRMYDPEFLYKRITLTVFK